jgi:hypothetical protein
MMMELVILKAYWLIQSQLNTGAQIFAKLSFWPCAWAGWRATIILGRYNQKSKGVEK